MPQTGSFTTVVLFIATLLRLRIEVINRPAAGLSRSAHYNLVAIPVAAGVIVHWGLDLHHERWRSRNEPLYHHRRRKRSVASPTKTAANHLDSFWIFVTLRRLPLKSNG
jgi:hypothetical protein